MAKEKKHTQIYKNAWFARFTKREKISDAALKKAIKDAEKGIISAKLGGNIIKQRIPRPGAGKSGGYRSIIVFKKEDKAFFIFGFSKSDRKNITKDELALYKKAAKKLLALSDEQIEKLLEKGALTKVK